MLLFFEDMVDQKNTDIDQLKRENSKEIGVFFLYYGVVC